MESPCAVGRYSLPGLHLQLEFSFIKVQFCQSFIPTSNKEIFNLDRKTRFGCPLCAWICEAGSGASTPKEGKSGDVSGATALYFHMVTSCSSSFPSTGVSPDTARSASQSEQMRSMVHILHPHPFPLSGSPFRNRQTGAW